MNSSARRTLSLLIIFSTLMLGMALAQEQEKQEEPKKGIDSQAGWYMNMEEAMRVARQEKKEILINFSGLPWCPPCQRLEETVLSTEQFKDHAREHLVLIRYVFAADRSSSEEGKRMASEYQAFGFPVVYLADAEGKPYARVNNLVGSAKEYIDQLIPLPELNEQRKLINDRLRDARGIERARALDELLSLDESRQLLIGGDRLTLMKEIVGLAKGGERALAERYATSIALGEYAMVVSAQTGALVSAATSGTLDARKESARAAAVEFARIEEDHDVQVLLHDRTVYLPWLNARFMERHNAGHPDQGLRVFEEQFLNENLEVETRQQIAFQYYFTSYLMVHGPDGMERALRIYDRAVRLAPNSPTGKNMAASRASLSAADSPALGFAYGIYRQTRKFAASSKH